MSPGLDRPPARPSFPPLLGVWSGACALLPLHRRLGPPWIAVLLLVSKRMHSLFVLRLFNDCVSMAFAYGGVLAAMHLRVSRVLIEVAPRPGFSATESRLVNSRGLSHHCY